MVLVVKNPPTKTRDLRDAGSSLGQEDPLEEGMAIDYSILAQRIPWTEQPGRLWSTGLQSQTQLKRRSMHAGPLINKNDNVEMLFLSSQFNLIDKIFPLGYLVCPAEFHFIKNFLFWLTNCERA